MADHPIQPSNSLTVWVFGGMTLVVCSLIALSLPCQKVHQRASDYAQAVPIHPAVIEQREIEQREIEQREYEKNTIERDLVAHSIAAATLHERHPTKAAGLGFSSNSLTEGILIPITRMPFPLAAVHAFHRFALPIATSIFLVTFGIWSLTSVENRALSIVEPST
ncbi:MAG: hypothetical protein ACK52S_06660 [Pirellula sp.]